MSLIQLILLSVIQGITEWLPISSSGHVLLASSVMGLEGRDELLINAVSNLGTLLAMLIYFRKDVWSAVLGGIELVTAPVRKVPLSEGARLALHIIVATPFALAIAALYEPLLPEAVQTALRSVYTVAAATIGFGLLLWWADTRPVNRHVRDMPFRHSILIGLTQAIAAIIPGTSRSGITMTAARALGYERSDAARFSMLIGAPILAAAGLYGALGLASPDTTDAMTVTLQDGLVVAAFAFVSGLASIWGLMSLLKRMSFLPFVIYRLVLGVALILASPMVFGWISA